MVDVTIVESYIGRGVGLQRGRSALQIGFLVCYNRSILSYLSSDDVRYLQYVVISMLVVVPSSHGLHPQLSSINRPDTWSVRVPRAHIYDKWRSNFNCNWEHGWALAMYEPLISILEGFISSSFLAYCTVSNVRSYRLN
jgi:hypothetical protein